ncbi:hypothetical protein HYU19_04330 [Candidatus Woesearchaeota archaeon]|nr:hypothetical protein [Candidatus Woesearchaeota archaeon]
MTNLQLISEAPISMAQLKENLKKNKKEGEELNFRAAKTEEYLNLFVTLSAKEAQELIGKIKAFDIPRLKEEHIIKIVDIMPTTPEEVKSIINSYPLTVSAENCKKIADLVKEHVKK